jgi:hypothetical protein
MGTGTFGGGGGGGGGGGPALRGPEILKAPPPIDELRGLIQQILGGLNRDYLTAQFCSPLIRAVYEEIFRLSVEAFQNHTWKGLARDYGVSDGPGCLAEWVQEVLRRHNAEEPNEKVREVASVCLEDFVMKALGDNPDLYLSASAEEVLATLDRKVFESTSGHFLGTLIWRVVEREGERLPPAFETRVSEGATQIADRIVKSFEENFYAKDQVTHRDLLRIVSENFSWFLKGLRS